MHHLICHNSAKRLFDLGKQNDEIFKKKIDSCEFYLLIWQIDCHFECQISHCLKFALKNDRYMIPKVGFIPNSQ